MSKYLKPNPRGGGGQDTPIRGELFCLHYTKDRSLTPMFGMYSSAYLPIVATNLLFYCITSLSTSISSSQTVVKFITEHKDCDSVIFKNELVEIDLENKLQILESLVYDILGKFTLEKKEWENLKTEFRHPGIAVTDAPHAELIDFTEVNVKENTVMAKVLGRIPEPLKFALFSTGDTLQQLAGLLQEIRNKIHSHHQSYIQHFVSLSLKTELSRIHKLVKVLDIRTQLLLELLKIYLPCGKDKLKDKKY